jgi:hypothetical protein
MSQPPHTSETQRLGDPGSEYIQGRINGILYTALSDAALEDRLQGGEITRRKYTYAISALTPYYCNVLARLWVPSTIVQSETAQQAVDERVRAEVVPAHSTCYVFPWPLGYERFDLKSPGDLTTTKGIYAGINAKILQERQERVVQILEADWVRLSGRAIVGLDEQSIDYEMITPPVQSRQRPNFAVKMAGLLMQNRIPVLGHLEKAVRFRVNE